MVAFAAIFRVLCEVGGARARVLRAAPFRVCHSPLAFWAASADRTVARLWAVRRLFGARRWR